MNLVRGTFGLTPEDNIGKIAFPAVQVRIPSRTSLRPGYRQRPHTQFDRIGTLHRNGLAIGWECHCDSVLSATWPTRSCRLSGFCLTCSVRLQESQAWHPLLCVLICIDGRQRRELPAHVLRPTDTALGPARKRAPRQLNGGH